MGILLGIAVLILGILLCELLDGKFDDGRED